MAYDDAVADRFRQAVDGLVGISEVRMMGGLCFLVNGNMLGGVDRTKEGIDRLMFRVGKVNQVEALSPPNHAIAGHRRPRQEQRPDRQRFDRP